MGGRRYTQAERDEAMGALVTSAVFEGDTITPNLSSASKAIGVPISTLKSWWDSRDKRNDRKLLQARAEAAKAERIKGGEKWLSSFRTTLTGRAKQLSNDDPAWKRGSLSDRARALLLLDDYGGRYERALHPPPVQGSAEPEAPDPADVLDRVLARAEALKLEDDE